MKKILIVAIAGIIGIILYQGRQAHVYAASAQGAAGAKQAAASGAPTGQAQNSHPADIGASVYQENCAVCHGEKREGILPAFPPLIGVSRQLTDQQIEEMVHHGKGRMPAFAKLQGDDLTALLHYLGSGEVFTTTKDPGPSPEAAGMNSSTHIAMGASLFQQNCSFCHGRDAGGGETGPDLTRSKLVAEDVAGSKIAEVVRDGRPEKNMPHFNFSDSEMAGVVAFIHSQQAKAVLQKGNRRGVDVSDLQTGSAVAGKEYFNGPGTCASCHSATGDLAGIASRYQGLQLEERMLYPRDVKNKVSVTLPSGQTIRGTVAYLDEFTVALRDADGAYHSWPIDQVKYSVDSRVDAHADLFGKYTDADIHNLMAYLQTLR